MTEDPESAAITARAGSLGVRLAASSAEVRRAQRLRYRVFYEELSAVPEDVAALSGEDSDCFDRAADHVVVFDHAVRTPQGPLMVATMRLLRAETAVRGFYSAGEFNIAPMLERNAGRRFLEMGRVCVLDEYRRTVAAKLLWREAWRYLRTHRLDVIFGCGSLAGTDVGRLTPLLATLRRHSPAPPGWGVKARYAGIELDALPLPSLADADALRELPPLLRSGLNCGAYVCEEAVIDRQFGTIDVFVILTAEAIAVRYSRYAGRETEKAAA